jgi:hypothetical protein
MADAKNNEQFYTKRRDKYCPLFLASAIRSSAKNHGFFRWNEQEQGTSARCTHAKRTVPRASGNLFPTSSEASRSCCLGGHGRIRTSRSLRNSFLPVEASPLEPTHLSPPATGTEPTKCTDEEFSRSSKVLY